MSRATALADPPGKFYYADMEELPDSFAVHRLFLQVNNTLKSWYERQPGTAQFDGDEMRLAERIERDLLELRGKVEYRWRTAPVRKAPPKPLKNRRPATGT